MNYQAFAEAMRARRTRFITSKSAPVNPAKKRQRVLQIVKFLGETAIVDKDDCESKEQRESRMYFRKLNLSNYTDAQIDELFTGLKTLFSR